MKRTEHTPSQEQPTQAERVASLHAEAAADYAHAQDPATQAEARAQLAFARIAGGEQAGTR